MVLKRTDPSSWFQHKNWFQKVFTESRDINQYMLEFMSPNQTFLFWNVFGDIFGPGAYFSKPIWIRVVIEFGKHKISSFFSGMYS